MRDSVRDYIHTHKLMHQGKTVLVGVSGGVDSMVLLHVLHELGYTVHVAHVNYQLRDADSDGDEAMITHYCAERGIPFYVMKADPGLKKMAGRQSFQEAARDVRYSFFASIAKKKGIDVVAVAHHLDDQAETLLLKLIKGSGLEGLGGMRSKRVLSMDSGVQLVRPLLGQSRKSIVAYATQHTIPWREDVSNASDTYERNVIRNEVLPLLKSHFGESVPVNLARSAAILQGYWDEGLQAELERRFKACCLDTNRVYVNALMEQPNTWRYRIALELLYRWIPGKQVSLSQAEALLGLLDAQVGRRMIVSTGTIWREREYLLFDSAPSTASSESWTWVPDIEKGDTLVFDGGILDISLHNEAPASLTVADPNRILIDRNALGGPLVVRLWKPGDRIMPLGMTGHKKVSDILTDTKVESHQRASIYVLEVEGRIVWIVGIRMADAIKVTNETKEIVQVVFHPIG